MTSSRETLANARLWLAFASMLFVSGITNVFPVFFPALLAEFGGSRGATAFTASPCWLGRAVLGPVAGFLVARRNPRGVAVGSRATIFSVLVSRITPPRTMGSSSASSGSATTWARRRDPGCRARCTTGRAPTS